MADVSSYDSSIPSGSSEIRKGDDRLRTHWWDLESALSEEHYFTDSTASGGEHKPGSSRVSYGSGPAPTSGDEGRLFYDVDSNVLAVQGSSDTTAISGAFVGAKARRSTNTTANAGTLVDVVWDDELYDTSGFFSASTSHMVIPEDGKYRMEFNAALANVGTGADGNFSMRIIEETDDERIARSDMSVQLLSAHNISAVAELSANSVVEARWEHDEESVDFNTDSYFAVTKLGN